MELTKLEIAKKRREEAQRSLHYYEGYLEGIRDVIAKLEQESLEIEIESCPIYMVAELSKRANAKV